MSDLIDRKELGAAIDNWLAIDRYYHPYSKQKTIPVSELVDIIKQLPSAQPEIIRCKDCIHRPKIASETGDIGDGFDIEFPDGKCPCQCSDEYYNWMPYDDWFCGNGERRTDE